MILKIGHDTLQKSCKPSQQSLRSQCHGRHISKGLARCCDAATQPDAHNSVSRKTHFKRFCKNPKGANAVSRKTRFKRSCKPIWTSQSFWTMPSVTEDTLQKVLQVHWLFMPRPAYIVSRKTHFKSLSYEFYTLQIRW